MAQGKGEEKGQGSEGLNVEQVGREISLPARTRLFTQGEDPKFFYVILSGKLQVFRQTTDGIRTDLGELNSGNYFGELALITGQKRSASVETVEESRLLEISKEEFDQVLDNNPKLARDIINQMAHWLVSGDKRLEQETVHQVRLRKISWFDYVLMLGLSIFLALVFNLYNDNQITLGPSLGGHQNITAVSIDKAVELFWKKEALFVDARKNSFFRQKHIKDAINLQVIFFDMMFPMFQATLEQKQIPKDKPILVYGGSISRRFDIELAHLLTNKGFEKVMVLGGDFQAWNDGAFPLEKQKVEAPPAAPMDFVSFLEWLSMSIFVLMWIPPVRRSPYLSAVCRLLLGLIFVDSALSKIMRPAVFALNVVDYGMMPAWGVNLFALILPWTELVAGLFLFLGIRTSTAATLIGGMNIIFMVGLINVIWQGLPINCGCFGEAGEPVSWWKVSKNLGMLFMAIQVFLYDRFFVLDRGGFVWRERKI
jgi:cAMP-binding proteins - catabolite gene activator and regulatory subunit of cAMP-dependent protein kinases